VTDSTVTFPVCYPFQIREPLLVREDDQSPLTDGEIKTRALYLLSL